MVKQLLKAHSSNKHVAKRILSNKLITHMPEYYSIGDENEADYVAQQSQIIWKKTEGALDWLKTYISIQIVILNPNSTFIICC